MEREMEVSAMPSDEECSVESTNGKTDTDTSDDEARKDEGGREDMKDEDREGDYGGEQDDIYTPNPQTELKRRGSVVSLSRVSFAAQLSRLTSLSMPLSEELQDGIRSKETAVEMCEALTQAGQQIGRWIETATKVLDGLDAEDDVEWAAQGKESLNEVDQAVDKFSGLINVYIKLIDELQDRPDIREVDGATNRNIVSAMEAAVSGWEDVQNKLRDVKDQVEIAMEWDGLWMTTLQDIQAELDACQTLVFELEEKRHQSMMEGQASVDIDALETIMEENPGAPFPRPSGQDDNDIEDSALLGLVARMEPLKASLNFLPVHLQPFIERAHEIFPTACEEVERRRKDLQKMWSRLNADAEGLKQELGEDRWVAIFRNAGRQAQGMLDSVERSMNKLREAIVTWDQTQGRNDSDVRKKMESYEAKKKHYGRSPSSSVQLDLPFINGSLAHIFGTGDAIQRVFGIIRKGIDDRFTVNGEIVNLDRSLQARWRHVEQQILETDETLYNLQIHSQQLRDSISSLASLDLNQQSSARTTPGTSPASSVALASPNRRRSPSLSGRLSMTSRKSSGGSHIPRSPYTLSTPSNSPRDSRVPPPSFSRAVSSPMSSTTTSIASRRQSTIPRSTSSLANTRSPSAASTRPGSSLSTKPRWNGSTKTDGVTGHNFKPLTLTTPSPYARNTPSPSPSSSGRKSSLGGASGVTRIPIPSPLQQNTLSPSHPTTHHLTPRLARQSSSSNLISTSRRTSLVSSDGSPPSSGSFPVSPSPASRTTKPELKSRPSMTRLRDMQGQAGSASPYGNGNGVGGQGGMTSPRISVRPASAMGGGNGGRSSRAGGGAGSRMSLYGRPPSGMGNRLSMPPQTPRGGGGDLGGDGKPRWRF